MSTVKTLTSVATAIALVAGIGIATAQSEEQPAQPATMTQATDQAVNDPNAPLSAPTTAPLQQTPAPTPTDPALQQPAAPVTPAAPAYQPQDNSSMTPSTPAEPSSSYQPTSEPAPRADRN